MWNVEIFTLRNPEIRIYFEAIEIIQGMNFALN